jgi:hypothetical protein
MAIPTMRGGKRRKNIGAEANDFIKAYLATQKSFSDSALAEKRGKLYDAQIKRYEEMNEASKARREGGGKSGGKAMSQEDFNAHVKKSLGGEAPAKAAKGQSPNAPVDGGGTPPGAARPAPPAAIPEAAPPAAPPAAIPEAARPAARPAPPPAAINPMFRSNLNNDAGSLTDSVKQASLGAIPDGAQDVEQADGSYQTAAFPGDEYNYSDDYNNNYYYGNSYEGGSYDVGEAIPDDIISYAAEGGAIEEAPSEDAPLDVALDAALRSVQSSYGLDRKNNAVNDGSQDANLEAFQRNSGGVPEEVMTDLLSSVDPRSKDQIGAVLQKVYGFHSAKGDMQGAAQAVGSIIQTARQESMDSGALALAALEKRDFVNAGEALIDAYNKVPDGRYVEGNVDQRGIGEALIRDVRTDKVVERIPLNPQTLQMAAKRFQTGSDFYNHLAQFARPSKPAPQRMALAYEGGPIEDEDEVPQDEIEAADKEDAALVEALPVGEAVPTQAAPSTQEDIPEGDRPASGAQDVEAPTGANSEKSVRPYVPYAPGMSSAQRRQVDFVNRRLDAEYKAEQAREEKRRVEGRQDARTMYTEGRQDQRSARTEMLADKRAAEIARRQEATAAETARRQEHQSRLARDPEYRREYELAPLAAQEKKDRERMGQIQGEVNRASLSGEDVDIMGDRPADQRSVVRSERAALASEPPGISMRARELPGQRLNITAKNAKEFDAESPDDITKAIDAYAGKVKPDKMGFVDPKQKIVVSDGIKSGMIDVASNLTALNRISANRAAETVFDAVYKLDMEPKVTRSDQGFRVTIGDRSVTMDNDTFRQLASLRGARVKELNEINTPIKTRQVAQERERFDTDFSRREAIDARDSYVIGAPVTERQARQQRQEMVNRRLNSNR